MTPVQALNWSPLRWHAEQQAFFRDILVKPKVLCSAGRRSGKTELARRRLTFQSVTPANLADPRYLVLTPTHAQTDRLWFEPMLRLVPTCFVRSISLVNKRINSVTGCELHFGSLEAAARFEGMGFDGVIVDEVSDCDPKILEESIWPTLAERDGKIVLLGRPKRSGVGYAWFREQWKAAVAAQDAGQHEVSAYTWKSADILDAAAIKRMQSELSLSDFVEQFGAVFRDDAAGVMESFSQDNIRACEYRPTSKLCVSSDFNVGCMVWTLSHVIEDRLETFDELVLTDSASTRKALDALWERYGTHQGGFEFYGDASASARKTSASSSDLAQIANDDRFVKAGRLMRYGSSNPQIVDRIAAANRLACDAAGRRRWHVDPRCKGLIRALTGCVWSAGKRELEKNGFEHYIDAATYIVNTRWPLVSELKLAVAPASLVGVAVD